MPLSGEYSVHSVALWRRRPPPSADQWCRLHCRRHLAKSGSGTRPSASGWPLGVPPYSPMFNFLPLGSLSAVQSVVRGLPASIRGEDSVSTTHPLPGCQRPCRLRRWKSPRLDWRTRIMRQGMRILPRAGRPAGHRIVQRGPGHGIRPLIGADHAFGVSGIQAVVVPRIPVKGRSDRM